MANSDVAFLPSVLDRLLDEHSGAAPRTRSRAQQLLDLRNAIRRDLEALLNTHQCCRAPPPDMPELGRSLIDYGAPDFSTLNAGAAAARESFRRAIEDIIRRFEPRFKLVKVTLLDVASAADRTLRFRIEALMYAEPAPERISFDSLLDPASQIYSVVGGA